MSDELADVVDKNNKTIGREKRSLVHSEGLLHRAVNIFILNSKCEVFLQHRSANKTVCPSKWDLSVSEHLKSGENYKQAALRGLKEELGINAKTAKVRKARMQKNEYYGGEIKDYEFVELYKVLYDGKIKINKKEVAAGRFFRIGDIKNMIRRKNNQFTPWFLDKWRYMEDNGMIHMGLKK